jgi:hypothetical protein
MRSALPILTDAIRVTRQTRQRVRMRRAPRNIITLPRVSAPPGVFLGNRSGQPLGSLSHHAANGAIPIPAWRERLVRASAVLSSFGPAPVAGVAAGESVAAFMGTCRRSFTTGPQLLRRSDAQYATNRSARGQQPATKPFRVDTEPSGLRG